MTKFLARLLRQQQPSNGSAVSALQHVPRCAARCEYAECTALAEVWFKRVLSLERKRSERSRVSFILVLLHFDRALQEVAQPAVLVDRVMAALPSCMRETDVMGWYRNGEILGAIFTELGQSHDREAALSFIPAKINSALEQALGNQQRSLIRISWHVFPESSGRLNTDTRWDPALYPEDQKPSDWLSSGAKRAIDIVGSMVALIFLAPLFLAVGLAVKVSSPGPILFRQERIGQVGRPFLVLKFRTMKVQNSSKIHELYVRSLISGSRAVGQNGIYKIQNDPRLTRIGGFLRKSSLDELPQFWNVLIGDMSLVGPRPPLPYETEMYEPWHRRRYLAAKPGITGLWQVTGRSRTTFDDMVRLDLRYLQSSSPWLDLRILCRTPWAVFAGTGAY